MKITNANVFMDGEFKNVEVQYENGVITNIGENLPDDETMDAKGQFLYAGMVETHIHGGFTYSFYNNGVVDFSNGEEHIREICRRLPHYGVTSCLPTIGADSTLESQIEAVRLIRKVRKDAVGADPFKIHFEGPYTNPKQQCAFNPEFMVNPTKEHTLLMTDGDLSDVELICVAPELPGAMEWIEWVTGEGVQAETCYTHADSTMIREAADRGLTQAAHLYNCFQPMHHRINGPVIGCLLDNRIKAQLTCDGYHVASDWIKLAIKLKGLDRLYGITDMTCLSGLPEGEHDMPYYEKIYVKGGLIKDKNGTICGGNMTWDEIMRTARDIIGLSMEEVGSLYSENPAKCLNITDRGKIEAGRRADFVLMDKDYHVLETIILGQSYYKA